MRSFSNRVDLRTLTIFSFSDDEINDESNIIETIESEHETDNDPDPEPEPETKKKRPYKSRKKKV